MKKIHYILPLALALAAAPLAFAQLQDEEDQYDRDYEACSEQSETKADALPEEKREEAFIQNFLSCMRKKGHAVPEEESDVPPENAEGEGVGAGIEE